MVETCVLRRQLYYTNFHWNRLIILIVIVQIPWKVLVVLARCKPNLLLFDRLFTKFVLKPSSFHLWWKAGTCPLSVKTNTDKFTGLRAETPARRNSAKTVKHGGQDFVYGVLFVTLLAFGAKTPVNFTAKCFWYCTSLHIRLRIFFWSHCHRGERSFENVNLP